VTIFLTKTQQWIRAAQVMKYLSKAHPHTKPEQIDAMAIAKLEDERPTWPWEYPWAEVVRSQRERRKS
jgi:hypothetical protein